MKSFKQHINESLQINSKKIAAEQVYKLYHGEIDDKTFAINCDIGDKDATDIAVFIKDGAIIVVSTDDMKSAYSKEDYKKIEDKLDDYVKNPDGYGTQLGISPEEKKQQEEATKAAGAKPKETDDTELVERIATDILTIQPSNIVRYFWRKSGDTGYLFFVLDDDEDVNKFISKI